MIFHRLGLINKKQQGFTLLEILLAMAISGIITGVITMTIFQVVSGTARTNNHMIAVRQAQNAGYWVSRDVQMSQVVVTDDDPGTPEPELVTLTWTDWATNKSHEVIYTLEDIPDSTVKNLRRSHSVGGGAADINTVAQFIDPDETICVPDDGVLTFTVTATVGAGSQEQSETRTYEIVPRPVLW
jgi:prepilin-type N-terminal cleavage/methylation domain-containing protein